MPLVLPYPADEDVAVGDGSGMPGEGIAARPGEGAEDLARKGTGSYTLIGAGLMVGTVAAERMDEAGVIAGATGTGVDEAWSGETGLSGLSEPGMTADGTASCVTTGGRTSGGGATGGIGVGMAYVLCTVLGTLDGSGESVSCASGNVRRSAVAVAGSSCSS